MANEVLEENQAKEFSDVVGTYSFTAEGGGAEIAESSDLITLKPGIRLHFFRYGLIYKKSPHDITASIWPPGSTSPTTGKPAYSTNQVGAYSNSIPTLENFYPARTSLNAGYLYLFNDNDPEGNDCHEYEVLDDGSLKTILWRNNKDTNGKYLDIRTSEGDSFRYKTLSEPKTFWFAYSPVQWTEKYLQETRKNEDKLTARMQKVECRGVDKTGNSHEHAISYRDLYTVHYDGHVAHGVIKKTITAIDEFELKQDQEEDDNDIYEDMFITLNDPVGCAGDIAGFLDYSYLEQQAIIDVLQTGEIYNDVIKRLETGEEKKSITNEEEQIKALFQLALTTYQLVYNDPEMISDYHGGAIGYWNTDFKGSGIRKEKILNILGVEERKEHRKKITSLRDDLGYFMSSDYYKNAWVFYHQDNDDFVLDGKNRITNHMCLLARHPHDLDRHIDLIEEYTGKNDDWEGFFADTIDVDPNKPINKLLNTPIEIVFLTGPLIDIENKLGGVVRQLTESYAKFTIVKIEQVTKTRTVKIPKTKTEVSYKTVTSQDYFNAKATWLRKHTVWGVEVIDVKPKTFEALLAPTALTLDESRIVMTRENGKLLYKETGLKPKVARYKLTDELVLKQQLRGKNIVQVPVLKTEIITETKVINYLDEIQQKYQVPETKTVSKYSNADFAQKIFDGKIFTGSLALLQVFNVMNAANAIGAKDDYKNIVNTFGITAELAEAGLYYRRSVLLNKGVTQNAISRGYIGRTLPFASNIGSGITVFICSWEAFDSVNARDYDAAWAWGGAGVAWGAFLFGGTTITAGGSVALAGLGFTPPGLIIAGIAIGLTALAYYLKDTPLEALFKNNVLSDAVAFNRLGSEKPWEYSKRMCSEANSLIKPPISEFFSKDTFRKWTDMKVAYQDLLDTIVCADIHFKPTKLIEKNTVQPWTSTHSVSITTSDIVSYQAQISFRQFLTYGEQLQYDVYYFESWQDKSPKKIILNNEVITIVKTKGTIPKIVVDFSITPSDLTNNNKSAYIIFVCRLEIDKNQYYPTDINQQARYISARFTTQEKETNVNRGLFKKKPILDSDFQAPVKIDTLKKILSKQ